MAPARNGLPKKAYLAVAAVILRLRGQPCGLPSKQKKALRRADGTRYAADVLKKFKFKENPHLLSPEHDRFSKAEGHVDVRCAFPSSFCPGCSVRLLNKAKKSIVRVLMEGNKMGAGTLVCDIRLGSQLHSPARY